MIAIYYVNIDDMRGYLVNIDDNHSISIVVCKSKVCLVMMVLCMHSLSYKHVHTVVKVSFLCINRVCCTICCIDVDTD